MMDFTFGAYQQIAATLNKKGLLFVGDCKMSSLSTRCNINIQGDYYREPIILGG